MITAEALATVCQSGSPDADDAAKSSRTLPRAHPQTSAIETSIARVAMPRMAVSGDRGLSYERTLRNAVGGARRTCQGATHEMGELELGLSEHEWVSDGWAPVR